MNELLVILAQVGLLVCGGLALAAMIVMVVFFEAIGLIGKSKPGESRRPTGQAQN